MRGYTGQQGWLVCTLLSAAAVLIVTVRVPQQLYSDAAWQMKCLQQFVAGQSPSLNNLTSPDPQDLSKNIVGWGTWWPPGLNLLAYPMVAHGVSIGDAVRVMAAVCLVIGCAGWIFWFSLFDLPGWVQAALALLIPWMRYPNNSLFAFSAEILVFSTAPWALWGTYRLAESWQTKKEASLGMVLSAALLGLGLGLRYVLKYSAVFVSLAALIYLAWRWALTKKENRNPLLLALATATLFFLIPVLGLSALNAALGPSANNLASGAGIHVSLRTILWTVSNGALGLADANSLLRFILLHPSHGLYRHEFAVCLLGAPGGIVLLGLLFWRRSFQGPAALGIIAFATAFLCMLGIWSFSGVADHDARHLVTSDMAILPIVLESGLLFWRSKSAALGRVLLALAAVVYLAIPFLYGIVSVGAKILRTPLHYRLSPTHLYNGFLATDDLASVREHLLADFNPITDVWYLPDPGTALELPGRAIIRHADFTETAELKKDHFRTSAPLRLWVLLPPKFESNGKGSVIRSSFINTGPWTRIEIPGSLFVLWRSEIR